MAQANSGDKLQVVSQRHLPTYATLSNVPRMARKANGAAIRSIRHALGISQQTLAGRVGVSAAALSLVEHGGGMRLENLRRLADSLGVPLDAITTAIPEPEEVAS
jgi:DNA-binding XRE family transcriptional regulator